MQGYRDHNISFNGAGYTLRILPREDGRGKLQFRYEKLTDTYRTEVGRIMRAKMSPIVKSAGYGLDAVRHASVGQAALSYMHGSVDPVGEMRLKRRFVQTLV